jgi:hypothetical protein
MNAALIGGAVVVTLVVIYLVYLSVTTVSVGPYATPIVTTIADGMTEIDSGASIPQSFNESQGLTFSYSCWVKVNDFSYRYGAQKVVFTKGPTDLSQMCPALLIDATSNTFLVKIDTFGGTEVIPVGNIPAKKWVHIAIAVSQDGVSVFLNGNLYIYHSLSQVPKQNSDGVHTSTDGGFSGSIAGLTYYRYLLTPQSIAQIMQTNPPTAGPDITVQIVPPYNDPSYWVNHLNVNN